LQNQIDTRVDKKKKKKKNNTNGIVRKINSFAARNNVEECYKSSVCVN